MVTLPLIKEKARAAIMAGIVGDALGVPVASLTREELSLCEVKNMLGYGRYDQPEGTWSDDTSMVLCTMESMARGYNLEDIGHTFCQWLFEGRLTSTGFVFEAGLTTSFALDNIHSSRKSARDSGGKSEDDNGNGALMRILPAALFFHTMQTDDFLEHIHAVTAITHAHPRNLAGCGIYALFVRALLKNGNVRECFKAAVAEALDYYNKRPPFKAELLHFMRLISHEILTLSREDIRSSGYVVHTLEAAVWCVVNYAVTKEVLLAAVNLGLDTDTTGMVAGGLGGLAYGLASVPAEWINSLARKNDIDTILNQFIAVL
ncbi:MAG: ADP-ribosylglycohydrolase family protein [Chitinivibrionales bacterium]|nr:ADP-ribosylglycohydrolase family protein [Chitinivibrionales bacterium]